MITASIIYCINCGIGSDADHLAQRIQLQLQPRGSRTEPLECTALLGS